MVSMDYTQICICRSSAIKLCDRSHSDRLEASNSQRMSGYSPNQQDLSQMCLLLQALRDPSRSDHVQATNALTTYIQNPVFVYNIMFVFGYGGDLNSSYGLTPDLRQLSGFVIKNYLFQCLHLMDAMVQKAVKDGKSGIKT